MKKNYPSLLKSKDKIALVSPAGFISEQKLEKSIDNLKKLGFIPYFEKSILDKKGYLAGTAKNRAFEINKMFERTDIKGIMCARGGYGSVGIANLLDYKLINKNPKAFIGYSDITYLNHALYKHGNLINFHGVAGVSDFNEYTTNCFQQVLMSNNKSKIIKSQKEENQNKEEFKSFTINKGEARGKLVGGNLSLLCSLIGTKDFVSFENKIVFIEEIYEAPYKIDRMLTHLINATDILKASAITFGVFNKCNYDSFDLEKENSLSLKEIIIEKSAYFNVPISYGFSFGHISNQAIFPFGQEATFDSNKFEIYI